MIFDRAQNTHRMYEVLCDVVLITTEILHLGRRPLCGPLKTEIPLVPDSKRAPSMAKGWIRPTQEDEDGVVDFERTG